MLKLEDTDKISKEIAAGEAVVLDVRKKANWDIGHIKGSINFPNSNIEKGDIPDFFKDTKIYTHCGGGTSGPKAAELLVSAGFKNVSCIKEGYRGWKKAGGLVVE